VLQKLILIAVAGGLGSLARYGLSGVVQNYWSGSLFPYGTVVVNILGCLVFGFLVAVTEGRFAVSPETRTIILVGFMGAFTTFSTFVFETANLLEDSEWLLALGNVSLQNFVGLAALILGLLIGRLV
jgi:fluoride exporter